MGSYLCSLDLCKIAMKLCTVETVEAKEQEESMGKDFRLGKDDCPRLEVPLTESKHESLTKQLSVRAETNEFL